MSKGVTTLLGQIGNERGKANESRALQVCSTGMPDWVRNVRGGTPEEDSKGIDLVFETDVGGIFLQVKSSRKGRKEFEKRGLKYVGCVVVHVGETDEEIRQKLLVETARVRMVILEGRK